jgi:hypothetical protein
VVLVLVLLLVVGTLLLSAGRYRRCHRGGRGVYAVRPTFLCALVAFLACTVHVHVTNLPISVTLCMSSLLACYRAGHLSLHVLTFYKGARE